MSDNVGLSTPRGSGTSGYVQRNRAFIRPRDGPPPPGPRELERTKQLTSANRFRQPDQGILDHGRKRAIEVQVFALRDELEEKGELGDDEIDQRCDELRTKLTEEAAAGGGKGRQQQQQDHAPARRFKTHQVHEQARAKIEETERIRRALHINKDYQEGGHWRRQEEKLAQKRKKEEEEIEAAEAAEAAKRQERELQQRRRRRYDSDGSRSDDDSRSDYSVSDAGDGDSRAPIRSVEREDKGDRGRGRGGHGDDDDDADDIDSDRGRGRQDGRRVRQRRDPSSASPRSPSHSRSRTPSSRSRSRSRSQSRRSRSRSRGRNSSVDSRRSGRVGRGGRRASNDSS